MKLTIQADNGSTLDEIVSVAGFDRKLFKPVEPNRQAMRSHGLVEIAAAIGAAGGIGAVFVSLEKLAAYCVENAKSIRIDISGFGVRVSGHWERNDQDSGGSTKV
jgi:hypothetical protein